MKTLAQAIREAFQEEIDSAPAEHPLKTDQCPSLTRFGHLRTWSDEERCHLADGCAYCEKMIAIQWRIERPECRLLFDYAKGERPDLKRVMADYLAKPSLDRAMVRLFESFQRLSPGPLAYEPEMRFALTGAFASEKSEPFHAAFRSEDSDLCVSFDEVGRGALELRVDNPSGKWSKVRCYLVPVEGEPLKADVTLNDAGQFGRVGKYVFPQRYSEIAARLKNSCAAFATPIEEVSER